jgi:SAM-dependent methyltransferase
MTETIPARTAYREWARDYDRDANKTRDLDGQCLRDANLDLAGLTVLELGAGTGKNTSYLAEQARQVIAMDVSPDMLAQARQLDLGRHVRFIEADIRAPWPLQTGSVDCVVSNLVLEHIEDLSPIYAEAHRTLKPGGLWYFSEFHPFRQMRGGKARYLRDGQAAQVEAYLHMIEEYVGLALAAGFAVIDLHEALEAGVTPSAEHPPRLITMQLERR